MKKLRCAIVIVALWAISPATNAHAFMWTELYANVIPSPGGGYVHLGLYSYVQNPYPCSVYCPAVGWYGEISGSTGLYDWAYTDLSWEGWEQDFWFETWDWLWGSYFAPQYGAYVEATYFDYEYGNYFWDMDGAGVQVLFTAYPNHETTAAVGWMNNAYQNLGTLVFSMRPLHTTLGYDFVNRQSIEVDGGGGSDTCWIDDAVPRQDYIAYDPNGWTTTSGSNQCCDYIGWNYDYVWYYRNRRGAEGLPMPCGFSKNQWMFMYDPFGSGAAAYKLNVLSSHFDGSPSGHQDWIENSRDGVTQSIAR